MSSESILLPNLLSFLVIYIRVFHQNCRKFSAIISSNLPSGPLFLFSSLWLPKMCGLIHLTMFHGSLRLFSHFLFFSCPSDSIISLSNLQVCWFSASKSASSPSSRFFTVVILGFNTDFFFMFYVSLLLFLFYSYILFLDFLHVFLQFFEYLWQPF